MIGGGAVALFVASRSRARRSMSRTRPADLALTGVIPPPPIDGAKVETWTFAFAAQFRNELRAIANQTSRSTRCCTSRRNLARLRRSNSPGSNASIARLRATAQTQAAPEE